MSKGGLRLILDTNIWRYVLDEDLSDDLVELTSSLNVSILACPAVVYETLALQDRDLRDRLIRLMTRRRWKTIFTEVYYESQEILNAIRGLRPEWLRDRPDLRAFRWLKSDWENRDEGFWKRVVLETEQEAGRISTMDGGIGRAAHRQAERARKNMLDQNFGFDQVNLREKAIPDNGKTVEGWDGEHCELWRWTAMSSFRNELKRGNSAYRDWLGPFVDLEKMLNDRKGYSRFWLYDVEESQVPRQWIRHACEILQTTRKISSGTPVDSQISAYFIDCDVFFTADKIFCDIAEKIRKTSSIGIAKTYLVKAGGDCVKEIGEVLGKLTG